MLALGKLGGVELNYSSDIDLIFLYDAGPTASQSKQNSLGEYYDRLVRDVLKLLTEPTELGTAYRVDLRLRPSGNAGTDGHQLRSGPALLRHLGPHLGAPGHG